MKMSQTRKEEVKSSLLANNMILYLKNPKISTKTLEPINTVVKVPGYKINIRKLVC
jgi:hypothetical protein